MGAPGPLRGSPIVARRSAPDPLGRTTIMTVSEPIFTFEPRWKEELVCSCPLGSLLLSMPMGVVSVRLPSEESWSSSAPEWAKPHWQSFRRQLREWCDQQGVPLSYTENPVVSGE